MIPCESQFCLQYMILCCLYIINMELFEKKAKYHITNNNKLLNPLVYNKMILTLSVAKNIRMFLSHIFQCRCILWCRCTCSGGGEWSLPPLSCEDWVQVLLNGHLFAEAAVVVCEDGVWVALHRLLHQLITGRRMKIKVSAAQRGSGFQDRVRAASSVCVCVCVRLCVRIPPGCMANMEWSFNGIN